MRVPRGGRELGEQRLGVGDRRACFGKHGSNALTMPAKFV